MGRYSGRTCRLLFLLVLTAAFFVAELVSGYLGNSIALLSDSFSMLADALSLLVGLAAGVAARRAGGPRASFGLARAEVLGALAAAVFLAALCFTVAVEAVLRLARPERLDDPALVLVVGALGLAVNLVGLLVLRDCGSCLGRCARRRRADTGRHPAGTPGKGAAAPRDAAGDVRSESEDAERRKKSEALNIRGVLLHVMGDALGSVVVVITAVIFYVLPLESGDPCNWQCYIDPSLTIVMVLIILSSAFPLIKETAAILLQMVPKGVHMEELMGKLLAVPGVSSVHEVHVWELVSGKAIATLHVKYQRDQGYQEASVKVREIFHHAGIHNVTIQFEPVDVLVPPEDKDLLLLCSSPCMAPGCAKHLCCPPGSLPLPHVNGCAQHNGGPVTETFRSCRDSTDVTIDLSGDDALSDHRQAVPKTQEDRCYENSTHF
ncbi:calcium/manganese antiporter SLC30A10 [Ctenodactylus gundi]